jgi:hypothetical protein
MWVRGEPASAGGPFLLNNWIHAANAQFLYCPQDPREQLSWTNKRDLFPAAGQPITARTIQISYGVRPVLKMWVYLGDVSTNPKLEWPRPMPKLEQFRNKAIVAEPTELQPYSHGSANDPSINVLYYDGAVRPVRTSAWKSVAPGRVQFVEEPYSTQETNAAGTAIWDVLDTQ